MRIDWKNTQEIKSPRGAKSFFKISIIDDQRSLPRIWRLVDFNEQLLRRFRFSLAKLGGDPRWNMVSGNLRFQGVHPVDSTDFCFDFHFLRRNRRESKWRRAENITVRDRCLVSSVRDVIRVSLPSMASDRVPRRESLALSWLYCFRWRGNSSNRGLKVYFLSEERKGLFWKSFIGRNPNSSIMIVQCVIIFN